MPSKTKLKITALAGGVGASKLLLGLYEVMDPTLLTIILNTGDHIVLHPLHFQEYLVKRRTEPIVKGIQFASVESAQPAPGVIEAIREADRILICPSNPLISIGPIVAVPQVRDELRAHKQKVLAICPIVGGKSLKGPSDKMLAQLGHDPTAFGVAQLYADFTATFVIDPADKSQASAISALAMKVVILPTVMKTLAQKRNFHSI